MRKHRKKTRIEVLRERPLSVCRTKITSKEESLVQLTVNFIIRYFAISNPSLPT